MEQGAEEPRRFGGCSEKVIGACIEVHRVLGPGLLESAYEECLAHELALRGLRFDRQRHLPVSYKGALVELGYRLDFVVEDEVVLEIKAVERLLPVHEAQVITYLKLTRFPTDLLVNFHSATIKTGLRRRTRGP
jgi:GxxExxY protein